MITGESFRRARREANMTQTQAALALQVAQRTIGNWERGKVIPERHWDAIRSVLPASDLPFPSNGPTMDEQDSEQEARLHVLRRARDLKIEWLLAEQNAKTPEELLEQQYELHRGATQALDWVELAITAGASARSIGEVTRDIVQVSLEAGTIALHANRDGVDALTDIVYRAGSLAELARQKENGNEGGETAESGDQSKPRQTRYFTPAGLAGLDSQDGNDDAR